MKRLRLEFLGQFSIFLLLFFAVCAVNVAAQDEPNPAKWTLSVETQDKKPAQGENFTAVLSAEIERGWHLYALEKIDGGPIPTRIALAENQPFELGKIDAPKPLETDDAVFGVVTKFYENSVKFTLPLQVLQNPEKSKLQIKVRYQICSDEMCLPPQSLLIEADL